MSNLKALIYIHWKDIKKYKKYIKCLNTVITTISHCTEVEAEISVTANKTKSICVVVSDKVCFLGVLW